MKVKLQGIEASMLSLRRVKKTKRITKNPTYYFSVRQPGRQPEAKCSHYSVCIKAGSAVPKVSTE